MKSTSFYVNARQSLPFVTVGALSFWIPDLAVHVWAGHSYDLRDVRNLTVAMPTALLIAYVICPTLPRATNFRWTGHAIIIGVWLMGGFFIMLNATVGGAGFATSGVFTSVVIVIGSVIPILTCMLATYDGSLLALMIVSAAALLVWAFEASDLKEALSHLGKPSSDRG